MAGLHQQALQLLCSGGVSRVSLSPGPRRAKKTQDIAISDSVEALYGAMPRRRATGAQNSARSLTCSWRSRAWPCANTHPGRQQFHPFRHTPREPSYILLRISAGAETFDVHTNHLLSYSAQSSASLSRRTTASERFPSQRTFPRGSKGRG